MFNEIDVYFPLFYKYYLHRKPLDKLTDKFKWRNFYMKATGIVRRID